MVWTFGLDSNSKAIWDRLDDKAKSIILGYAPPDQSRQGFSSSSKSPFGKPPSSQPHRGSHSKAQVNLHAISAYDFLIANMHDMATNDNDPDPDDVVPDAADPSTIPDNETDVRLINAAKSSSSMPTGDIRRVMSKSSTRRANSTHIEYYGT
jgi:hypothetical protein